ncbi:hypothetical protein [Neobacillus vireti]|uniref:Lipoprotein n=1 Tax=Neobacillus vireti LMG 21834 TaxID=1131730 RepID=A0AB94IL25_9BACI|nr:hypothetical protein [Neobacillus vireti]ETI67755.1 hypothetical protein BAVI_15947 [Neobacillus vireti LMG 21834]KLT16117.1 hypothetical protein AA980_19315 [Neobacillus vireti]
MNKFWKLLIGLFFVFSLTGCFGESYDFNPPSVKLSSNSNIESEELAQANIVWRGEGNKIKKELKIKDIFSLAKHQQQMNFIAGEKVDLLFEHTDFAPKGLSVSVWQNDKKFDLEVNDISFYLPKDKGEYVIEVNLHTDRGDAQYVGNINIGE